MITQIKSVDKWKNTQTPQYLGDFVPSKLLNIANLCMVLCEQTVLFLFIRRLFCVYKSKSCQQSLF